MTGEEWGGCRTSGETREEGGDGGVSNDFWPVNNNSTPVSISTPKDTSAPVQFLCFFVIALHFLRSRTAWRYHEVITGAGNTTSL